MTWLLSISRSHVNILSVRKSWRQLWMVRMYSRLIVIS
jgi:hypothetical protein